MAKVRATAATALHQAIWLNDIDEIKRIVENDPEALEQRDLHGDTPLLLALRCSGRFQAEIVDLLLNYGASVHTRDKDGWKGVDNAILCDHPSLLRRIFVAAEQQTYGTLSSRLSHLYSALASLPDFYMKVVVEAHSWIPGVSTLLPKDTIKIWKKGSALRCDYSIKGLEGLRWIKGNMSQVLPGQDSSDAGHVFLIDRDRNVTTDLTNTLKEPSPGEVETGIGLFYTTPRNTSRLDASALRFVKKGSLFRKANVYKMKGLCVNVRLRPVMDQKLKKTTEKVEKARGFMQHLIKQKKREMKMKLLGSKTMEMHLTVDQNDVIDWSFQAKSKDGLEFTLDFWSGESKTQHCRVGTGSGKGQFVATDTGMVILAWRNRDLHKTITIRYKVDHFRPCSDRLSIDDDDEEDSEEDSEDEQPHPIVRAIDFETYYGLPCATNTVVGVIQTPNAKHMSKSLQGKLEMDETVSLKPLDFFPVLEFLAPSGEHIESLRQFFAMKLPPGFPVAFELPIVLSVKARYKFETIQLCQTIGSELFHISS